MRHRRVWKFLPFALLAVGVFGFARLADHYSWGGGTALLIGVLMLALFIVIVGPLTLLPEALRSRSEDVLSTRKMLEALTDVAREGQPRRGSVSTREGARLTPRPPREN